MYVVQIFEFLIPIVLRHRPVLMKKLKVDGLKLHSGCFFFIVETFINKISRKKVREKSDSLIIESDYEQIEPVSNCGQ